MPETPEVQSQSDDQIRNRRRLIQRFSVILDEAHISRVSNNDIRRLIEDLDRILTVGRQLERYPKGLAIPDPNDVVKSDHCATGVLRRFATQGAESSLSAELLEATKSHVAKCSVCRARVQYFERIAQPTRVCGVPVVPHQPSTTVLLSENNITPGIGGAKRDVVNALSINRGGAAVEGLVEPELEEEQED